MRNKDTLRMLAKYLSRYRLLVVISFLLAIAATVMTIYLPIMIGSIVDLLVGVNQVDIPQVVRRLTVIIVMLISTSLCQYLMSLANNRIVYNTVRDLRVDAFSHMQILPLKYLDSFNTGEIVNKVINDIDQCADGLLMGFTQLFTGILTILGTLYFMVRINYRIALIVLLLTPLPLLITRFISRNTYNLFRSQSQLRASQTSFIEEMIGNQKIVQAFSRQKNTLKEFDEINEKLTETSLKATFFSSLTNPSTRFVNAVIYAVMALTGAFSVIGGLLTVGSFTSFLSYASQYTKPFNEISSVITELQNALACASRVFELMNETPEIPDKADAEVMTHADGNIAIDNVDFSYNPSKPFITGMNLAIPAAHRVALVGPTGCGKTTLINLLMRFYEVDNGCIRVDERDITDITRESLRRNYGMVLQETWLKEGTIADNIRIGKPDATMNEIIEAAKKAHAHSFIMRMPEGYDTYIGEDGGSLSQGQKQLLCISRIFVALPPMLILDEATSSIDTRTELKIQDSFARLMKGRTSFIVAHRLSTIKEADLILVMKDGKIIEQGTHDELLKNHGFYHDLYNSQF
ncbi:MAG: ABC transporter ATP-binding protein/permease [Erysipelotrichaceae bacterium]|nr:ABC transporter ATP-binding protein/permease [Erysipelotrichaceae bacterium]